MDDNAVSEMIADPKTYADPVLYHELFGKLRREAPVRWTEPVGFRPFWAVTSHQHIVEIERQPQYFINAPRTALRTTEQEEQIRKVTGSTQAAHTLIQMDDPGHKTFRKLTQAWFMPPELRKLEDAMGKLAGTFVDRLEAFGAHCDFARDIAVWYPLHALMVILGVPEQDAPLMHRLTQQHFAASDPSVSHGENVDAGAPTREVFAYFTELTAKRRNDPHNDIVSLLADAEIDGEPISDFDRNSYYFLLAIAGHDTTSASISGLLHALMDNPDQFDRLRADRSLLDSAINEGIRWTSPVKHFFRTATTDYQIAGQKIRAGDSIMLHYPSANFDETVIEDPFTFKIDRVPNRHVAFGFGIHQCLGQHLAKLEMKSLFTQILDRVESIQPAGDPQWLETNFVGGLKSLPVQYTLKTPQPV